jgi:hypothetical protein
MAGGAPAAAVVLGALAAPRDASLDDLLGEVAARLVREELLRGARAWAADVAPGRAFEATTVAAAREGLAGWSGPVLLVAPDVPGLDARLARDALSDLEEGAGVVVGPTTDGTPYLVGLPSAGEDALALVSVSRDELFAMAAGMAGGLGMLRSERRLVSAADARALAADPATPLELAAPLGAGLDVRARRRG